MADEKVERVSANAGGLDEHRFLTTSDLPLIVEEVKKATKSSSSSSKRSSSSKSTGGKSK